LFMVDMIEGANFTTILLGTYPRKLSSRGLAVLFGKTVAATTVVVWINNKRMESIADSLHKFSPPSKFFPNLDLRVTVYA